MPVKTAAIEKARDGKDEQWCLRFRNSKGENMRVSLFAEALFGALRTRIDEVVDSRVVEVSAWFDEPAPRTTDQPLAVWLPPEQPTDEELHTRRESRSAARHAARLREADVKACERSPSDVDAGKFLNPYAFVFTPDRANVKGDLKDGPPAPQNRWCPDLWSGRLCFSITTKTPLLVLDEGMQMRGAPPGHKEYRALEIDGKPVLPGSVIKGVLSAHYEAVTNSRLRVFGEHDKGLSYRDGKAKAQYSCAPRDLLPEGLEKAKTTDNFSPADRVFGFVRDVVAWRSALRIHRVDASQARILDLSASPVPLAVLGEPHKYGRFVLVEMSNGRPLPIPTTRRRRDFYSISKHQRLAGRKFYWTHRDLPDDYWSSGDGNGQPETKRFREFVAPGVGGARRTDLNRSISSWIDIGSHFEVTLDVVNLSGAEVGALLWLLDGTHKQSVCRSMGYGKPLGFGSTQWTLNLTRSTLCSGTDLSARYRSLASSPLVNGTELTSESVESLVEQFRRATADAWGVREIEETPHVKDYLAISRGRVGLAVRYPRTVDAPNPNVRGFSWFVANEKQGFHAPGLPTDDDVGLPRTP